jgi:hypothetical protein
MQAPKSPCLCCAQEDREHCAASCQRLIHYRRNLDALDPDEAGKVRRYHSLGLGGSALRPPPLPGQGD